MALLELIFKQPTRGKIGVVTFDATVSETHRKSNDVVAHPIEDRSDISDHIRRIPEELAFTGLISNFPIAILASATAASPIEGDNISLSERATKAYEKLRELMDAGELVDVVTTLRTYENMAILDMAVERNASNGQLLNATLNMREVIITSVEFVPDPSPETGSENTAPKQDLGTKKANETNESFASKAFDFVSGVTF